MTCAGRQQMSVIPSELPHQIQFQREVQGSTGPSTFPQLHPVDIVKGLLLILTYLFKLFFLFAVKCRTVTIILFSKKV